MNSQGIYRGEINGEKVLHIFPLENGVNLGKVSRTYGTMEILKMIKLLKIINFKLKIKFN